MSTKNGIQAVFILWHTRTLHRLMPSATKREGPPVVKGNLMDHHFIPTNNRFTIPATILFSQDSLHLSALIDSGSEQNLPNQRLVEQAQIDTELIPIPHLVSAINGVLPKQPEPDPGTA
ncbi:hypothetical protein ATANTOWER_031178, partial [Ataeniobius toweri]|nr:hypothetical protein [Ataeniobius toweri]